MSNRDRVVVITGAGRGLGRAYAERLASEGARVAIAEIDAATGRDTAHVFRFGSQGYGSNGIARRRGYYDAVRPWHCS